MFSFKKIVTPLVAAAIGIGFMSVDIGVSEAAIHRPPPPPPPMHHVTHHPAPFHHVKAPVHHRFPAAPPMRPGHHKGPSPRW